ncbi:uncharacterized protein LOC128162190 [Crassostrea angulata]|uniref:uncharacterized protein LOC128162190 n=1 Tax=Magallana angulata TaxID=2784310 RepID=UPI0022B12494|nr:uncharacterized protein LOC128162190 [Crassostrea angulata]
MGNSSNKYSVANKEAYLASHKRKVKVSRKEVPKTATDLKENIKACIRDKKIPVVQADDREDGWQEFQELLDFEVFLLDCKLLNDDMKKKQKQQENVKSAVTEKKSRNEVDVMVGVTAGELRDFQVKNKLQLPTNVILDTMSMVGVISAGCHGVGRNAMSVSDYVIKMRVFDASGELRTYTPDSQAMFRAVIASFGCFGVVYDITLKMEPEIVVKTETLYYNLGEVFCYADKLKSLVENNWSTHIFWFPYNSLSVGDYNPKNDELWVRLTNKAPPSVDPEDWDFYTWRDTKDYISQSSLSAISPLMGELQSMVPYFNWVAFQSLKYVLYPSGEIHQEHAHSVHFRKHIDTTPVDSVEFIFDYDDDFDRLLQIIHVVVKRVDHYEEKDEYPLLALEMRFMAYSDAYLGSGVLGNPATGGSGHVICIEIISSPGSKEWDRFSKDVGQEWMSLGGVPHLAKHWDHLPGIYEHIQEKMAGSISSFKTQLKKSGADPKGMFLNETLKKLLNL